MNIKILKLIVVIFISSIVIVFSSEIMFEEYGVDEEIKSYYAKDSSYEKLSTQDYSEKLINNLF